MPGERKLNQTTWLDGFPHHLSLSQLRLAFGRPRFFLRVSLQSDQIAMAMAGRNVTLTVTIPASTMGGPLLADLQADRLTPDEHKLARSSKVPLVSAEDGRRDYNLPAGMSTFEMIEQQVRPSASPLK